MKKRIILLMLLMTQVSAAQHHNEELRGLPNVSERVCGKWDLSADMLYWFASEEASAVWADILKVGNNTSSFTAQDFNFHWDPGFRLGAGYNLKYDQWDTQLFWTSFHTEAHQSQNTSSTLIPLEIETIHPEFFAADLSDNFAASAKIRWELVVNMFDWELGRNFWVSKGFSLRPFIGVKGGWINQSIKVDYNHLTIQKIPTANSGREHLKNNFWGVGPLAGVNTKWKLRNFGTHYPSFFGDFSVAGLWGTWNCNDVYTNTAAAKVVVHMKKSRLGALMLRGFWGAGWDIDFNKGRSHFATRLGYEMQLWINQLRLPTSQLIRLHGDLTLQGMTFNCRFDF